MMLRFYVFLYVFLATAPVALAQNWQNDSAPTPHYLGQTQQDYDYTARSQQLDDDEEDAERAAALQAAQDADQAAQDANQAAHDANQAASDADSNAGY